MQIDRGDCTNFCATYRRSLVSFVLITISSFRQIGLEPVRDSPNMRYLELMTYFNK